VPSEDQLEPGAAQKDNSLDPTQVMSSAEAAGTVIGRYHLLQKIGEGGMGEVWLAEQKEPVRRRVALKLVKAGMNTREVIARFESERQALALMDHPTIAKVFDAGSTPQGAPYFVMEYVAGTPITEYCDNHRLSPRQRLEIFMHVCEGVQHAHQKAIIHRDLKPSNILVTEVNNHPAPKIIDFGVAKALTQRLTADTMFTRVGAMIGTPEYMSPEQALSSGEDIDTRTDVYSLGIIFYELLTGVPPIELRKIALDQFLRKLREEEPTKPSTKIKIQDAATMTDVAHKRQAEPPTLVRELRGDLDSIALKALEKDRTRRYGSPSDFAADIERYLKNEPVMAVPPSVGYRARKFARRYRVALATGCAFAVVLIIAAAISIRQSIRANREAAVAQAVNNFLQNDLLAQASASTQSSPNAKPDPDIKVRTALDRAAQRIESKFGKQPEVEASIRSTIGQTYIDLGLYAEAKKQIERALEIERRSLGERNPTTLRTMSRLGKIANLQGNSAQAESLLGRTLESQRGLVGRDHPDTLYTANELANTYEREGNYAQAEALHSQTLDSMRRVSGQEDNGTLSLMNNLAIDYFLEGKYAQAEALLAEVVDTRRRVWGPDHPNTLMALVNLASTYRYEGNYAKAEQLYSQALDIGRHVLGPEHPNTLATIQSLALVYSKEGKYVQAEELENQTLETQRRVLGPDHPDTLRSMGQLAAEYGNEGNNAQAVQILAKVLEIDRRVLGPDHSDTLINKTNLAFAYAMLGRHPEAETLSKEAFETAHRVLGAEHPLTLGILSQAAAIHQMEGKYAQAEKEAAQVLAGRRHSLGNENPDTTIAAADLALAYVAQGKFAEAQPLAREAMQTDTRIRPDDWQRFRATSLLGASLAGQKKYADAESLLVEGYQGMVARKDRIGIPDRYHLDRAHEWLVRFYQASGKPEKAAEWEKK